MDKDLQRCRKRLRTSWHKHRKSFVITSEVSYPNFGTFSSKHRKFITTTSVHFANRFPFGISCVLNIVHNRTESAKNVTGNQIPPNVNIHGNSLENACEFAGEEGLMISEKTSFSLSQMSRTGAVENSLCYAMARKRRT